MPRNLSLNAHILFSVARFMLTQIQTILPLYNYFLEGGVRDQKFVHDQDGNLLHDEDY